MEIWREIKGYEGLYQVSNLGRVKACEKEWMSHHNAKLKHKEQFLKFDNNHGYMRVALHKDRKYKHYQVHRLVAEAFIPNPDNKPYVNHKNYIKKDNRVENLEWCTHKENCLYSIENSRESALKRLKPKSTEHYIYINHGKYMVMFSKEFGIKTRYFLKLEDAIKYRDKEMEKLK